MFLFTHFNILCHLLNSCQSLLSEPRFLADIVSSWYRVCLSQRDLSAQQEQGVRGTPRMAEGYSLIVLRLTDLFWKDRLELLYGEFIK